MGKKINLNLFMFFILCLCIIIGSIDRVLVFPSILVSFLVSFTIATHAYKNRDFKICIGFLCLLIFQNLLIGVGAHSTMNRDSSLKFLTQIPFISIFTVWFIMQIYFIKENTFKFTKDKKWFLFLTLCVIFSMLVDRGNIQAILINIRNLTIFYMAYEIGRYYIDSKEKLDVFYKSLMKLSLIVLFCGIILLLGGYELYESIGIDEVYIAKGSTLPGGKLDDRFYTTLISKQIMRMGSLYYEPVNLAYFFVLTFLLSLLYKPKHEKYKIINVSMNALGLLLTFGKGGYLLAATSLGAIFITKIINKIFTKTNISQAFKIGSCFIVLFAVVFCIYYYKNIGAAVSPHFWAVIRTWDSVLKKPYGYGLGTGGNMSLLFNSGSSIASYNSSWLSTGGETALMSFMYQIGIQGVFCIVMCFMNLMPKVRSKDSFLIAFCFLPIALLGTSLLQDNTFTPQCIVAFMLVFGAVRNLSEGKIINEGFNHSSNL